MKEVFKKIKSSKNIGPIFIGFISILLLEYAIYPLLTSANTFRNIFGGIAGVILFVFLFYYLKVDDLFLTTEEKPIVKKPNPKQFTKEGFEDGKPFVKTRKRKPKSVKEWEDEVDLGGHE